MRRLSGCRSVTVSFLVFLILSSWKIIPETVLKAHTEREERRVCGVFGIGGIGLKFSVVENELEWEISGRT